MNSSDFYVGGDEPSSVEDMRAWCKAQAKAGADALHARAAATEGRKPRLTDAESAAQARAKIDRSQR